MSERLGHVDYTTTMKVYAHVVEDERREAAQSIDELAPVKKPEEEREPDQPVN